MTDRMLQGANPIPPASPAKQRENLLNYIDFITERGPQAVCGESGAVAWAGMLSRHAWLSEIDPPAWATDTTPAPAPEQPEMSEAERAAFERQVLVEQWLRSWTGSFEFLASLKQQLLDRGSLSDKQWASAAKCYDREQGWKAEREAAAPAAAPVAKAAPLEDGMYRDGDAIYKVIHGVNGSGRQYAKQLVVEGDKGRFTYAPGAIRKLTADQRMDLDEARKYGALYGMCIVCGATLTDEESIARGIGPVCEGRL